MLYNAKDQVLVAKISSATLASRTNAYLHQISSDQAMLQAGQGLLSSVQDLIKQIEAQEPAGYRRPLVRYFSEEASRYKKPEILCEFCLAADHASISCFMPQADMPWMPERDRVELPTTASYMALLCSYCRHLGHANCAEQRHFDDLFSNEDEKRAAIERHNNLIFSNEIWAEPVLSTRTKSPTRGDDGIQRYHKNSHGSSNNSQG